ncbi:MAG TPA: outer membrane beta-barrel protein [Bacteroidales bacterium]|nr:outer membrane beta-barrel protein [Bacteroidales bacterium]
MSKLTFILAITLYFFNSSSIFAQGLEIGVYAEPQLTWITSDESNIISDGSVVKLNTGIEFDAYFMPNYAISLGLNLNNQGGRLTYGDSTILKLEEDDLEIPAGVTVKHNYQYVGLPVGLKLTAEELGYTTFYFHGGIMPMFNINANASSSQISVVKQNIQNEINFFNLNYYIEIGMQYRLAGNTKLVAGFKWSSGFNDVTISDLANNNLTSAGIHAGIIF